MGRVIKIWFIVLLASFMCTESQAQLGRILSNASKAAGSGLFSKKKKGKEIEVKDPKTGKIKKIRYTYRDWKTEDIYAKRGNWKVESPYEGNSFSDNFNIGWGRLL
ncbi:hypothetical protein [Alloprevotella tannerae]|uniref:hypothetical protein n=1 Tax=Alloprevotella tannerae TaxID=76122 RepID=UPI0028E90B05|nr:hypothetical protein [Alloprevotella tannerae]